jgi:phosphoglycolate phosphatase-like HAD superfamily hydrolase
MLLLFDIDGTLMLSGGAGLRALGRAFEDLHGLPDAMRGVECDGKTDPGIVREVLAPHGLGTEACIARTLRVYLEHLARGLDEERAGLRVLPGVAESLAYLAARPGVGLGLATGNVEAGARLKLSAVGLRGHFTFGGFGSDAEARAELVRVGVTRGRALLGAPVAPAAVIGDTPRDIQAAHAASALAVGVASGRYAPGELERAGADLVLESLEEPARWFSRLEGLLHESA